jgi:ATP-dependent Clp protease ATP-binding subunit ClpA
MCSATAKDVLLRDGFDARYGARHLKRSVERLLVSPLSNLVASDQVELGDLIYVDVDNETEKFTFGRVSGRRAYSGRSCCR